MVLAAGSIGSPKLLARFSLVHSLPGHAMDLIGRGLTDHPTTHWLRTYATHIGDVEVSRDSHAKIVFYSRGLPPGGNGTRFPFNVEMNVNHEYWHLRENDPGERQDNGFPAAASIVEVKFSFGNCLDGETK